jgi:hypothetical protein
LVTGEAPEYDRKAHGDGSPAEEESLSLSGPVPIFVAFAAAGFILGLFAHWLPKWAGLVWMAVAVGLGIVAAAASILLRVLIAIGILLALIICALEFGPDPFTF